MVPATLLRPFCQLPDCALDGIRAWTAPALSLAWNSRSFLFFFANGSLGFGRRRQTFRHSALGRQNLFNSAHLIEETLRLSDREDH